MNTRLQEIRHRRNISEPSAAMKLGRKLSEAFGAILALLVIVSLKLVAFVIGLCLVGLMLAVPVAVVVVVLRWVL